MRRTTLFIIPTALAAITLFTSNPAQAEKPPAGCTHAHFQNGEPTCKPGEGELKGEFCCAPIPSGSLGLTPADTTDTPTSEGVEDTEGNANPNETPSHSWLGQLVAWTGLHPNLVRILEALLFLGILALLLRSWRKYLWPAFRRPFLWCYRTIISLRQQSLENWRQNQYQIALLRIRNYIKEVTQAALLDQANFAERAQRIKKDGSDAIERMKQAQHIGQFEAAMAAANQFFKANRQPRLRIRPHWYSLPTIRFSFSWLNPFRWKWVQRRVAAANQSTR